VRLHLLLDDLPAADRAAGLALLQPISIPYARYKILIGLANVELAMAHGDHPRALTLVDDLLAAVASLTRPEVPEAIRIKGDILIRLGRFEQALQTLTEARTMAEGIHSQHELWSILSSLAEVNSKLGREEEAKDLQADARKLVQKLAGTLDDLEIRESFLNQRRVKVLMG
jgi:uncharacterized protein HemY